MKNKLLGKYVIKEERLPDGRLRVTRTCQGFNSFELLGHLTYAISEIIQQMKGIMKPDIIKRRVVK